MSSQMNWPPVSAVSPSPFLRASTRPPTRSRAASTVTSTPASPSAVAAASPQKPAPTTTTSVMRPASGAVGSVAGFDLLELVDHLLLQIGRHRRLEQRLVDELVDIGITRLGDRGGVDRRHRLGVGVAVAPVGQQEARHLRRIDRVEEVIGLVGAARRILE